MSESRTWLASVLFLDIVGYTKVPVDQQLVSKRHFVELVAKAIHALEKSECIQLDTGDGCAICHLGDPEKLYPVALALREQFIAAEAAGPIIYQVRMGLNLGPVKVVEGISGERNCIGAGINDAQRIMDFADANQLLVSKSYFEMVSNMSSHYAEQLSHFGTRSDKHDKLHEIYQWSAGLSPASQPVVMDGGFNIDDSVRQRLTEEFAKYVGRQAAIDALQSLSAQATTLAQLCQLLADSLNEDDCYSFNEFLEFYGYRQANRK